MNRVYFFGLIFLLGFMAEDLLSCSPMIMVNNRSNVGVRVAVFPPGGGKQIVSAAPGERNGVSVNGYGQYIAVVVPSQEWLESAKLSRQVLSDLLAKPQNLTPDQIRNLIQQLNAIETKIKQYERAAGSGNGCTGTIENDQVMVPTELFGFVFPVTIAKNAAVDVTTNAAGQLQLTCR